MNFLTDIEIPMIHSAVRANNDLMNKYYLKVRDGEMNLSQIQEELELEGYRHETVTRYIHGIELRVKRDSTMQSNLRNVTPTKKSLPKQETGLQFNPDGSIVEQTHASIQEYIPKKPWPA